MRTYEFSTITSVFFRADYPRINKTAKVVEDFKTFKWFATHFPIGLSIVPQQALQTREQSHQRMAH